MSEDVTNFLKQVRELGDRRIEEDEARSRELEEKILQEKRERQARRAERARSISPQKSSPANTPPPSATRTSQQPMDGASLLASSPVLDGSDALKLGPRDDPEPHKPAMDNVAPSASSPTKENESPFDSDPKRGSFAGSSQTRASPLSWQRRPNSQAGARSRPLSMVAAENAAVRSSNDRGPTSEENVAKDQISQAPSPNDPASLRQTAEKGPSRSFDASSQKPQPPGMSRESSTGPQEDESVELAKSPPPRGSVAPPFSLTPSQRLDPPTSASQPIAPGERSSTPTLPTSGRTSPIRATSPTKGVGGFVQSAMMKRSDSVNKRWSVQSPSGLARAGSIATNRQSRDLGRMHSPKASISSSRPMSMIQPVVTSPTGMRPSSSHGRSEEPTETKSQPEDVPPNITINTRVAAEEGEMDNMNDDQEMLPVSPSKTMDPRRWSPTKSSWLESALSKPESPKPKPSPATSQQPSWMVELNKAKAQKANNPSVDLGKPPSTVSHKHAVSTGGLMRAPPPGTNVKPPATISGLEGIASTKATSVRSSVGSMRGNLKKAAPTPPPAKPAGLSADIGSGDVKRTIVGNRPKPGTPPKKDFRANLKHRPTGDSSGSKGSREPADELKNVFGNLRRAATQKHVAADEFKDNLLRGKAALNMTGGPKKSERKDELKDAILKKNAEFKKAQMEGRSVARKSSNITDDNKPLPEGLAKRAALGQSQTRISSTAQAISKKTEPNRTKVLSQRNSSEPLSTTSTSSKDRESPVSDSPVPGPKKVSTPASARPPSPQAKQTPDSFPIKLSRASTEASTFASQPKERSTIPSLSKEPTVPATLQAKPAAASSLADRFNPALAGLLARGPLTTGPVVSDGGSGPSQLGSQATASGGEPQAPGPKLTHITKSRARGPRRKAPTAAANPPKRAETTTAQTYPSPPIESKPKPDLGGIQGESETAAEDPAPIPPHRSESHTVQLASTSGIKSSRMPPRNKPAALGNVIALVDSSSKVVEDRPRPKGQRIALLDSPRPMLPPETPGQPRQMEPAQMSMASIHEQVAIAAAAKKGLPPPKRLLEEKTGERMVQPPSPKKLDMNRMFKFDHSDAEPPKPVDPFRSGSKPLARPKSIIEKPKQSEEHNKPEELVEPKQTEQAEQTKQVEQPESPGHPAKAETVSPVASKPLPPRPLPEPTSSQINERQLQQENPVPASPETNMGNNSRLSATAKAPPPTPPKPIQGAGLRVAKSPLTLSPRPLPAPPVAGDPISPPPRSRSPMRSPYRQSSDIAGILSDFFGSRRPRREYQVDTASILATRPKTQGRIQTLKAQLFQVSDTGKKQPIPAHHERVLFEREMYICPHTYQNEARKKVTEVYFWAGDEVPLSSVEDAEIFVNKEARAMGGKVVKIQQGKETPEFIQALGGIIIIRRGSSNKYDSLAPNLLCGRRHLGQIVFDEVDFSSSSLCSGFPFLITQQGRCHLWKGKGSDVDELSCARLIGMDLTLMGELDEVDDGSEPESFWAVFDGRERMGSADHWRLKPNYQRYGSRLFCSDSSSRHQMYEISPFSQVDLSASNIYIIDAFFELYILVGARAQSEYASFRNALDFAQEYSILAAGMEDRPFVPVSTVVLEGIPKDLKSVFRKWRDLHSPTMMQNQSDGPTSPGLRRGKSLRIVPLNMALQALSD